MEKRKHEEEENLEELEDGECTESETDEISEEITPDPDLFTNSESDREEEQGSLLVILYY